MKTFSVTITNKWVESLLCYEVADTHKKIADNLPLKNKRILCKK